METLSRTKRFFLGTRGGLFSLSLLLALLFGMGACAAYMASQLLSRLHYPCPFKFATGWNCPGCGSTRALSALSQGEWLHAFFLNPFLFLIVFAFLGGELYLLFCAMRPRFRPVSYRYQDVHLYLCLALLVVYAVVRNVAGF